MDTRGQGRGWGTGGATPDPHGTGPVVARLHDARHRGPRPTTTTAASSPTRCARSTPCARSTQVDADTRRGRAAAARAAASRSPRPGSCEGLVAVHARRAVPVPLRARGGPDRRAIRTSEIVRYLSVHRGADGAGVRTLSYFDGVNMAERATAPALFSVALLDQVCPPSTVYAARNHYGSSGASRQAASRHIGVHPQRARGRRRRISGPRRPGSSPASPDAGSAAPRCTMQEIRADSGRHRPPHPDSRTFSCVVSAAPRYTAVACSTNACSGHSVGSCRPTSASTEPGSSISPAENHSGAIQPYRGLADLAAHPHAVARGRGRGRSAAAARRGRLRGSATVATTTTAAARSAATKPVTRQRRVIADVGVHDRRRCGRAAAAPCRARRSAVIVASLVLVARQDVPLEARRAHAGSWPSGTRARWCGRSSATSSGPTCAPTSSGGSSSPVQRWMSCRSTGSFESLAQTRSRDVEDPEVGARAAARARLDLEPRVAALQLARSARTPRASARARPDASVVHASRRGRGCGPT